MTVEVTHFQIFDVYSSDPPLNDHYHQCDKNLITLIGQNHATLGNPANQGWGENRRLSNVDYRVKLLSLGISAILAY